ncbi:MAG: universal stress protein [Proteobacteria bacterium]|nr:universal stress protein [Pseudomonadota bacterium]MBU1138688.1 universal stress protein [Pseudomonadota bacterium]
MKILVALDTKEYSKKIVRDVARLAENTLADIIFLGVQESAKEPEKALVKALLRYQQDVYSYFSPDDLPYADFSTNQWQEKAQGDWSISSAGMKDFTLKIRSGSVAKQTISVAKEMECNLIIIGCSSKCGCEWDGEMNVPLRIAEDAPCSVLVVKDVKNTNDIISILDQSAVSQDSLEMVNQLATLHDAGLKIVGVTEKKEGKKDQIEKRMVELLKYYNDRKINTWVKVVDSADVKDYVTNSSREAIIALWMGGKQSLIQRLFTQSMVDKLLETTKSSLFILR